MDYANPDALVSTDWLAENLDAPGVRVIDATWYLPTIDRDPRAEYAERHIPGAIYFDIDAICDAQSDLPHMLPNAQAFADAVGALGIGNADKVVAYDGAGGVAAGMRAWWMFRVFGHDDVAILDGGLGKWVNEDRPTEAGSAAPNGADFTARFRPELVRAAENLLANLDGHAEQVLDARSPGRFAGIEPEPRPSKKVGHIPGSLNVPYNGLVDADNNAVVRPAHEIAKIFADAGLDMQRPVACSCGSGVTAAVLAFGLYLIGHEDAAVYDGSWTDWGNREDTPVET